MRGDYMKAISRSEKANLPEFKSHDEARKYFKERYGFDFMMQSSEIIDERKIYFYLLLLNRDEYMKGQKQLEDQGFCTGMEFFHSYQSIQIYEDGDIHTVH